MLFSLIRMIVGSVLTVVIIYVILVMVELVPKQFEPEALFGDNYKKFNQVLKADSESKSLTAGVSGFFYRNLNHIATPETADDKNDSDLGKEAVDTIMAPINKTKKTVDQYNQSIENQKKELDSL